MEARPIAAAPTTAAEIAATNVRAACGRAGWSASDLGRAIGMSRSAVQTRWRGERQWQLEDLDAVAEALGTTPWALQSWDESSAIGWMRLRGRSETGKVSRMATISPGQTAVSRAVTRYMREHKLSRQAMADLLGISASTLDNRRSRGAAHRNWTGDEVIAIQEITGERFDATSIDAPHQPAEDEARERAAARATRARRVGQTRRAR